MDALINVGVTLIFALAVLFLCFFMRRRELCRVHRQNVLEIKSEILTHDAQIKKRNACLNAYDFMKLNLKEVLCVQKAVEIL